MSHITTQDNISWLTHEAAVWQELPGAARRAALDPGIEAALISLSVALEQADVADPTGVTKRIQSDPARTTLRTILAQLAADRLLRVVDWLADEPHRRPLFGSLFAADASQRLQSALRLATRHALLTRMTADLRMSSLALCAIERARETQTRRTTL